MFGRYRKKIWIGVGLVGLLAAGFTLDSKLVTGQDRYEAYGRGLEEFGEAFQLVTRHYFKEVPPGDLTTAAIDGMLEQLDPYTQFFDRRALDQLRIDTQGKFGGLGITISKKDGDVPVVMSVIEGTPADTSGLVVGDRIVKIDAEPTAGKTLQEVVDVLRGTPGDPVTVTLDRPGRGAPFDQPIIRDRISINSVLLAEEVEPGIGFVSMTGRFNFNSRFSEKTGAELTEALTGLKARNVKGIILDLRGNPGGLLTQAIAVADKFLRKGQVVVSTKGRSESQNQSFETEENPVVEDTPLVVLVDGHSASASEIVAGAIQDSDRGLILGTQTFGKGSVQTVRHIGNDKALKLTTAVYYTPSGRSIHKASDGKYRSRGPVLTVADTVKISAYELVAIVGEAGRREDAISELEDRFSITPEQAEQLVGLRLEELLGMGFQEDTNTPKGSDPEEVFKTAGGRTVYGGGGITPDVEVASERPPRIVMALDRNYVFFDFAVHYAVGRQLPDRPEDFEVDESVMSAFRAFVADSTHTQGFLKYQTSGQIRLAELEKSLKQTGLNEEVDAAVLSRLRKTVEREREVEFQKAEPWIRAEIERAMANRVWGLRAQILASLQGDKQFQEAVRILADPDLYKKKMRLALASGE